jgi:hypothetical protein
MFTIKVLILPLIFILYFFQICLSQNPEFKKVKNGVFLELGGNAVLYSLNYERIFHFNNTTKLSIRSGASVIPQIERTGNTYAGYFFPVEVNYLIGSNKSHLEIGTGYTFGNVHRSILIEKAGGYSRYREFVHGITFRIGYRYFNPEGGVLFRLGFTPIFETTHNRSSGSPIYYFGGMSIGKCF